MKLKKLVTVLSVALFVFGLVVPVLAQKDKLQKDNTYLEAEQADQALRTETIVTKYGTLTRYKENALPKVNADSTNWTLNNLDFTKLHGRQQPATWSEHHQSGDIHGRQWDHVYA
jgi:hypothetical protein